MSKQRVAQWMMVLGVAGCASEPGEGPSEAAAAVESSRQGIVGGVEVAGSSAVVGVGISVGRGYSSWMCTGTLIAPNLVLTARHCVSFDLQGGDGSVDCSKPDKLTDGTGPMFRVTTLSPRPSDLEGPGVYKGTGEVWRAPGTSGNLCGQDMALIRLEGAGVPARVATPIVPRVTEIAEKSEHFSAVGFGMTDPKVQAQNDDRYLLAEQTVTCVGKACLAFMGETFASEWQGTARTCPGDSGGPALDSEGRVFGVLSRGPQGCLSSLYGDVGSWRDEIARVGREAAEAGGYPAPAWALPDDTTPRPAAGEPCSATKPCADGLSCGKAGDGPTCLQSCDAARPACPEGLICEREPGGPALCVPPPVEIPDSQVGDACSADEPCTGGLFCWGDESEASCVPPCGEGLDACPSGYACTRASADLSVCAPRLVTQEGGCAVASPTGAPGRGALSGAVALALAFGGLGLARRRAARKARRALG